MAQICDDVNIQNHLTCFSSYYVTLYTEKTDSMVLKLGEYPFLPKYKKKMACYSYKMAFISILTSYCYCDGK